MSGDTVVELARTSYGTGGYVNCNDITVEAFSFYPYVKHDFFYPQTGFLFPVTSLIFNKSVNDTLKDVQATLSVDQFFNIVSPSRGGLSQTQLVNPYIMPPKSMSEVFWIDTLVTVSTQDTSTMQLSVTSDVIDIHGNHVALSEISNCNLGILPRRYGDIIPPVIEFLSSEGSYNGSICNARCSNMLTIDSGPGQSGVLSLVPSSVTNMQLNVPKIDSQGRASVLYSVCVIDSMKDGFMTLTVTDIVGNADTTNFTYCTIADTLAPLITQTSSKSPPYSIALTIAENRPWDRGIDSINIISDTNYNVTYNPPNNW